VSLAKPQLVKSRTEYVSRSHAAACEPTMMTVDLMLQIKDANCTTAPPSTWCSLTEASEHSDAYYEDLSDLDEN
jgi:hypothetical protein